MKEKILVEDWFQTLDHQKRPIHVVIVEDEFGHVNIYENGILHLKRIKK